MEPWEDKNRIPINIWDDYCEDEGGETFAYVEDSDISDKLKKVYIKHLFKFLKTLDLTDVEFEISGTDIAFKNLTHDRRESLVHELNEAKLTIGEKHFDVYSES